MVRAVHTLMGVGITATNQKICSSKNNAATYFLLQDFDAGLYMSTFSSLDLKNLYFEAMRMLCIRHIKDDQDAFGDDLI